MAKLCEACGLSHAGSGAHGEVKPADCEVALWQRIRAGLAHSNDRIKALRGVLEHLYEHIGPDRAKRAHAARGLVT